MCDNYLIVFEVFKAAIVPTFSIPEIKHIPYVSFEIRKYSVETQSINACVHNKAN